jgi:carbonic anhydrase
MKRRDFLAGTAVGVGLAAANTSFADAPRKDEQEVPAARQVLKELMDGNHRFVSGKSEHPHITEDWLKRLIRGQKPMATILSCSDSRVPLELLFDQGFGDLFTIRVAGNVVTRYGIGSMEYAQQHLRTPLFMVLGHEGCGDGGDAA